MQSKKKPVNKYYTIDDVKQMSLSEQSKKSGNKMDNV